MVIGLLELVLRFVHWVSYVAHGRKEWLVVVQDYSHRLTERSPAAPKKSTLAPDGTPYLVRSVPGWSGENPRYRLAGRMRDHLYPVEVAGLVPGYVETLPNRAAANARAAGIRADVLAGRWPWDPGAPSG